MSKGTWRWRWDTSQTSLAHVNLLYAPAPLGRGGSGVRAQETAGEGAACSPGKHSLCLEGTEGSASRSANCCAAWDTAQEGRA